MSEKFEYLISIYYAGDYYNTSYYYVVAYSEKQAKYFLSKEIGFNHYIRDVIKSKDIPNDPVGSVKISIL